MLRLSFLVLLVGMVLLVGSSAHANLESKTWPASPEDITPAQAADMIDYYVKLLGVDHVGVASDDMFTTEPTMNFVKANPGLYADGGYMPDAFALGATGCGEWAKILPSVTDELWKRGYTNENLAKIYGGNKMQVNREVWEGITPEDEPMSPADRAEMIEELKQQYLSR